MRNVLCIIHIQLNNDQVCEVRYVMGVAEGKV